MERIIERGVLGDADQGGAELRTYLKDYYGRVLQKTEDLERQACCATSTKSRHADVVAKIPQEVKARYYGCGCPVPEDDLTGLRVLDLGSGSGLDAFILASYVGESGAVVGLDMTDEQLEVARRHEGAVAKALGHARPNTSFVKGFIETAEGVESDSIDLVVSNCVINLSPCKDRVFETIHRVLREGGELYISDIVADRRVPEELQRDRRLVAECLGGALYEHDLFDTLRDAGFADPRVVSRSLVEEAVGGRPIRFYSLTIRAMKLTPALDRRCEDYGQLATYLGTCRQQPAYFALDDHHVFEARRPAAVCRNTARIIAESRLGRHFEVTPPIEHFGLFPCGPSPAPSPAAAGAGKVGGGGACC